MLGTVDLEALPTRTTRRLRLPANACARVLGGQCVLPPRTWLVFGGQAWLEGEVQLLSEQREHVCSKTRMVGRTWLVATSRPIPGDVQPLPP